jgi:hypothetical protein
MTALLPNFPIVLAALEKPTDILHPWEFCTGASSVRTSRVRTRSTVNRHLPPAVDEMPVRTGQSRYRADLGSFERGDYGGVAFEGDKLHLVRLAITVDMHHRTNITGLQAVLRNGECQYNTIVFLDHQ